MKSVFTLVLVACIFMSQLYAQENQKQETVSDAGTDAVQTQAQVVPAEPKKISAVARLKEILPKALSTPGWKKDKKMMLALGKYSFPCTNPKEDKAFFEKRQLAAQAAVLLAKANMIESIKSSAEAYRAYRLFNDSAIENSKTETMTNAMKNLASAKLLGVTTLNQTEAWDGSKYEIAVMVVWSEKLEETARAIWLEKAAELKPKENGKTVEEWLEKQDLASMCGPWQFVDKDGIRWFLGVAARKIEDLTGADEIEAKETAKLTAMGDALLSLKGDIYSEKASEQSLNKKGNEEELVKKFLLNLSEACKAEIAGLGEIYSDTVQHPYTDSEIYVSVYGISQESVLEAISAEDRTVLSEQIFNKGQTIKAGRNAANRQAIDASKNNPKDFEEGKAKQERKLQRKEQQKQQTQKTPKKGGVPGVNGGAEVDYDDF